jgi:TusA-related sulfurtransferase
LNVTEYFNPIDCRSLGVIRTTLAGMEKGEILEVHGNRFQHREIAAWTNKFKHPIIKIEDVDGLVKIFIEKGGLK